MPEDALYPAAAAWHPAEAQAANRRGQIPASRSGAYIWCICPPSGLMSEMPSVLRHQVPAGQLLRCRDEILALSLIDGEAGELGTNAATRVSG